MTSLMLSLSVPFELCFPDALNCDTFSLKSPTKARNSINVVHSTHRGGHMQCVFAYQQPCCTLSAYSVCSYVSFFRFVKFWGRFLPMYFFT